MSTSKSYLVLLLLSVLISTACKPSVDKAREEITVRTVKTQTPAETRAKEYTFTTRPLRISELSFRVGGPVLKSDILVGNYYKKGAVIAEIDPRDFIIRKDRAEAVYQQTKAEYERVEALYKKNSISASAYDKAKADYAAAKAAYDTACNELNDTRLVAPTNGYVSEVYMEQYQDVKPSQRILSFIDIDELKVEAYLPENVALSGTLPKSVTLKFDNMPDATFTAAVAEVSKSTSRNNLSYLLTALLPNKEHHLLAGMSGKLYFDVANDKSTNNVVIPQKALCNRPVTGEYVWVYNAQTGCVNRQMITNKELLPNGMVMVSGLQSGAEVATTGLRFLSEGTKVIVSNN